MLDQLTCRFRGEVLSPSRVALSEILEYPSFPDFLVLSQNYGFVAECSASFGYMEKEHQCNHKQADKTAQILSKLAGQDMEKESKTKPWEWSAKGGQPAIKPGVFDRRPIPEEKKAGEEASVQTVGISKN